MDVVNILSLSSVLAAAIGALLSFLNLGSMFRAKKKMSHELEKHSAELEQLLKEILKGGDVPAETKLRLQRMMAEAIDSLDAKPRGEVKSSLSKLSPDEKKHFERDLLQDAALSGHRANSN